MSSNPILDTFLNEFGSAAANITAEQFTAFLSGYLGNAQNFEVAGSTVTGK
jgi:pyridoxal/pyridoxine/pyridoxamine kinase